RLLRDGGVPHPLRAELLEQPDGGLEHPFRGADVLPEAHHGGVAPHLAGDALGDRLPVRHVRHVALPSAHTSTRACAGSASGAAFAASTAVATACRARSSAASTSDSSTPSLSRRSRASLSGSRASHSSSSPSGRYLAGSVRLCP